MEKSISVIIPTYNRVKFLPEAIESVLAQTYPYFELIIVDDGSDDNTASLVQSYDQDIIYVRQKNRGPAAARNRGVQAARFNYLAFLDSDDRFVENKLAVQLRAMQMNPGFQISHTQETWYRHGRILNQKKRHTKESGDIFSRSLELCVVGMSTVMVHRKIFERFGGFDEEFPCCEDYEFWLRVSASQNFLLIDKPLTIKDGGREDQLSRIFRVGMDKYRIKAIMNLLAAGFLTERQKEAAFSALRHKCIIYGKGCIKHGRKDEGKHYLRLPETIRKSES